MLAHTTHPRPTPAATQPAIGTAPLAAHVEPTSGAAGLAFRAMPFDALRFQYAGTVMAGFVQRSILASSQLERTIDALEKLVLGPLARQR
jgi:hypothetical protein